MTWRLDFELAWLLYRTERVFGREVIYAALDRAILKTRQRGIPLVPEPPPRVLEHALRVELQQVLRLH